MERNLDNIVKDFYKKTYDEDERLTKDNTHKLELITTTTYIDKYLKNGAKILEVGAGTGAYSIYYAKLGYEVESIELSEENLAILKSKITPDLNIKAHQGNAIDLSRYEDNTFDITLVLGPLYHVFDKEERKRVIEEAIRVTKKDGIIYYAFINKEELIFYMSYMSEVESELSLPSISIEDYIATDGAGRLISEVINEMDEETYRHYVNYHLSICNRRDLIGYSGHILAIARKK